MTRRTYDTSDLRPVIGRFAYDFFGRFTYGLDRFAYSLDFYTEVDLDSPIYLFSLLGRFAYSLDLYNEVEFCLLGRFAYLVVLPTWSFRLLGRFA